MSRNFELLSQLESELQIPAFPKAAETGRAFALPAAPTETGDTYKDETFRLVQRVFLSTNGTAPRLVLFCGVESENRSSSVCASIGRTLAANTPLSVCLVDANFRSPRLSALFGVNTTIPLQVTHASIREQCIMIDDNLWLAELEAPGSQKATELPPAQQVKERLAALRTRFDFILMDAPGANTGADASVLGQLSDGAILVIEANSTRRAVALKAKQSLEGTNVRILGSVLNNRTFPIPEGLYRKL